MNQAFAVLLRLSGFNRPAPKTPLARQLRRVERLLLLLALLYAGLQTCPQVLFAHSATAQGITFYSRAPLPPAEVAACAARARALLARSELAEPARPERVFICDTPGLFTLFGPASARAFAFSVPLTDNVFVAQADFAHDQARRAARLFNVRTLSGVVAHEITHGLIRRRVGWWRGVRLPAWLAEGYCDYVAGDGSFPEAEGRRLMALGQSNPEPSFRYFEGRLMVSYLLEERRLTFEQMVARAGDFAGVEAETRGWVRGMRDEG